MALWTLDPRPGEPGFDLAERRTLAWNAARLGEREQVAAVVDLDADGVQCRLYRPNPGAPTLVALHGGGWVLGDLDTHDAHWRRVANRTGWAVLAVDYRRSPEHVYPAACDDVDSVIAWVRTDGDRLDIDTARVAVVGDSAGGQLALVAGRRNPGLAAIALIYPCIDPRGAQPSYRTETGGLTGAEMDWYWQRYTGADLSSEELHPLTADLRDLPPTLVLTAEHDPLRDEGERLAERLAAADVPVTATRFLGMIHGFWRWPELFNASDVAVGQLAGFLDGVVPRAQAGPR